LKPFLLIITLYATIYSLSIVCIKDGDTFVLSDSTTVRLIGIDTPEKFSGKKLTNDAIHCNIKKENMKIWGNYSTIFVKQFLNKEVTLSFDKNKIDYYGRTLAYIYLLNDTISINEHIIKHGYAKAYTKYSFSKKFLFIKAQSFAQYNTIGLWKFHSFKLFADNH
jgi:micrococcal nuclease